MKYQLEIVLDLPREMVIELFDNPDNMKHWQQGFVSMEHMSGKAGEKGAKARLKYKMGMREVEMVETIINRNLPHEFSGTYEAKGVWNEVNNFFYDKENGQTKWITLNDFRFSGFMKIIAFFMSGSFKKQSFKYMEDFKTFAESKPKS